MGIFTDSYSWNKQWLMTSKNKYRKTFHIRRTLVGIKIVDHSDLVGASLVGAAPTTSSLSAQYLATMEWAQTTARRDKKHLKFGIRCVLHWKSDDTSYQFIGRILTCRPKGDLVKLLLMEFGFGWLIHKSPTMYLIPHLCHYDGLSLMYKEV